MNMKKITVSVIVPCYNVSDYVEKSIESLCTQSLENMEIIAINDGSKDDTLKKLKKLSKKYNNLLVIDKKNEGVSVARNVGLDVAKGEYIGFLDSDDWVDEDCFAKMYKKAKDKNYDIVACDTNAIYPDSKMYISSNIKDNDTVNNLLVEAYAVIWNKIYKKELLEDIRFKQGISFCEDVLFLYMVYAKVKKVGAIHEAMHYYLQRTGSLTYTYNDKLYELIEAMDEVIIYYKNVNKFVDYEQELEYSYVRYLYATFIKRLAKTKDKKQFKNGYNFVREKVKDKFPNYRKNEYLKVKGFKNFYLKNFNWILAILIFVSEKNKMN